MQRISSRLLLQNGLVENQYLARKIDDAGLYFYRARYYDPVLKRFISEDPIGLAGGLNVYGYVGGDPVNWSDPWGLKPGDIFKTPDAAALDAGKYARNQPNQAVEHGGWIYPEGSGYTYNYGKGTPWSMPRTVMDDLRNKCPKPPVASWHTHPWSPEIPRPADAESSQNKFSPSDIKWASDEKVPAYLDAPSGITRVVNPDGSQRVVGTR